MIIPVGFAQVNYRFTGGGVPRGAECTLGVDHQAFVGTTADLADAMATLWEDNWLPQQITDISLASVLVKKGPNTTGQSAEVFPGLQGPNALQGTPPQVAILVKKVTALGGREGRGRMYIPGYSEGDVTTAGEITGADLTSLQASADTFLSDAIAADIQPVLLHNSATAPTEILSFQVDSRVGTQRRRLRG